MTISYNWLSDYLPTTLSPEKLSDILTSIGLEVESLERYEEVKGSLEGLIIGEVIEVKPHPNADKLKLALVNIGETEPLHIVCGAPNVAEGQKVVVARVGTTIYPLNGNPVTMKAAKIRGEESLGMICAEDEIGLGENHEGILVLDGEAVPGTPAASYFEPEEDWTYEIGLTPNRMDATSHIGVARDVCAWLSAEKNEIVIPSIPDIDQFKVDNHHAEFSVEVENPVACPRYTGISLSDIHVGESPDWLKKKLDSIGVRPINNVVDITNFVLHECGQPLHAFDGDAIFEKKVIIKNLPEGTAFVTLDGQERKLDASDLMICDAREGMCIAGVFGGLRSGVTEKTKNIFLESACFDKVTIRRTSFRHDLRTDAAMRFEKGVDISGVQYALKRAVNLMKEICGASVTSDIIDVYPNPRPQTIVSLNYSYLHRLSGKAYEPERVKTILTSLGFEVIEQDDSGLQLAVPYSKSDILLPADLVEEVMRIDGYDQISMPTRISMAPSPTIKPDPEVVREKVAAYLTGNGFYEIFTNSITNSSYFEGQPGLIKLMNSLNTELDVMRPSLLETGLEAVAHNLNHKQTDLLLFEFGRVYTQRDGFEEREVLALLATGNKLPENWISPTAKTDNPFIKGHILNICHLLGAAVEINPAASGTLDHGQDILIEGKTAGKCGHVADQKLKDFDIRQPIWYAELDWKTLVKMRGKANVRYRELPRYPSMRRDLALILDESISFAEVERAARTIKSNIVESIDLFDVFKSPKLGVGKKSYAVSFTFVHREKTLTDKEIDKVMEKLINAFERNLGAEIRK